MHGRPERAIHQLVLLEHRLAFERARHDARLVVIASASQVHELHVRVRKGGNEQGLDSFWLEHRPETYAANPHCQPEDSVRRATFRRVPGSHASRPEGPKSLPGTEN